MGGWIKLHRQLQEHWLWEDKPFSYGQAWIDLLMLANHKDEKLPYKDEIVVYGRGTVTRSISELSKRWGWGREKTRKYLALLEADNMVTVNATTHRTTITIEKYTFFNDVPTANQATNRQQTKQPTDNQPTANQATKNKNDKNIKNDKNDKNINNIYNISFRPPSVQEVSEYCTERKNSVNAEAFVDFYESKGWYIGKNKMKDWKSAVRTWERRDKKPANQNMTDLDDLF